MAPEAKGVFDLKKLNGIDKVSLAGLEGQHRDIFVHAVSNILSTEIAHLTYAQIVDGLPLSSVADDTYDNGGSLSHMHPLYTKHNELCPGVLERTRQFLAGFDPNILRFDSRASDILYPVKVFLTNVRLYSLSKCIKPPRLALQLSKHA